MSLKIFSHSYSLTLMHTGEKYVSKFFFSQDQINMLVSPSLQDIVVSFNTKQLLRNVCSLHVKGWKDSPPSIHLFIFSFQTWVINYYC